MPIPHGIMPHSVHIGGMDSPTTTYCQLAGVKTTCRLVAILRSFTLAPHGLLRSFSEYTSRWRLGVHRLPIKMAISVSRALSGQSQGPLINACALPLRPTAVFGNL